MKKKVAQAFAARFGESAFSLCITALLAAFLAAGCQLAVERPSMPLAANSGGGTNIEIAYPSSTNICVGGCNPHQNWIEFYLPPAGFRVSSLRLKTSLFAAQVLTIGTASKPCEHQGMTGYACLDVLLRARLLAALTGLDLAPLSQLRDTNNWWLEYSQQP